MLKPKPLGTLARRLAGIAAAAARASRDQCRRFEVAAFHARHGDRGGLSIVDPDRRRRRPWDLARVAEFHGRVGDRVEVDALRGRVIRAVVRETEERRVMILGELAKAYEWMGDERAADALAPPGVPDGAGARMLLGTIAAEAGRLARARRIAKEVERAEDGMSVAVLDAIVNELVRRGRRGAAATALARLLELLDDDARTLAGAAAVYLRLGDPASALRLATRAEAVDRRRSYLDEWYLEVAEVYLATGGPTQRRNAATRWKRFEDPVGWGKRASDFAARGRARAAHGYQAEARAWLDRAVAGLDVDDDGDDPGSTREVLVEACVLLGDVPLAIEQAAAIVTHENRVRAFLGIAEHCQLRAIEATPAIEAALASPAIPRGFRARGASADGARAARRRPRSPRRRR
jgi:tetratricopeptide (TPR) repeat protein